MKSRHLLPQICAGPSWRNSNRIGSVRSEPREAAGASEADAASTSVRAAASERLILKPPYIAAGVFLFYAWLVHVLVCLFRPRHDPEHSASSNLKSVRIRV
jgi:hypothetical protein